MPADGDDRHVVNGILMLVMGAVDKTVLGDQFRCPCLPETDQENPVCDAWRISYSLAFLLSPGIGIGLIAVARETPKFEVLLLAVAWAVIALLNGDYIACLCTCVPYQKSCKQIKVLPSNELPFSDEYEWAKTISQFVGCCLFTAMALLYCIYMRLKSQYQAKCGKSKPRDGSIEVDSTPNKQSPVDDISKDDGKVHEEDV